jgi:pyridoxal phosphate enzyme (YggS family)
LDRCPRLENRWRTVGEARHLSGRCDRMITSTYAERVTASLPGIRDRISAAAERSGRGSDEITLVAVTKAHPIEAVEAALSHGLFDLGENRTEELARKRAAVEDGRVRWHMIGHVQRRKAPGLVGGADLVHSIDSIRLAERLSRAALEADATVPVLVQVNTSGEESKSGFQGPGLKDDVATVLSFPGLEVRGLMTMAPFTSDEVSLRSTFQGVRVLHEELRAVEGYRGEHLSMGMTNDFEIAIEEGSTMIRIGTALFGKRVAHD